MAIDRIAFGDQLGKRSIKYYKQPIRLRAGGETHWYTDFREGLASGGIAAAAGQLIVEQTAGLQYVAIAGMGVGGRLLAAAAALAHPDPEMGIIMANDDRADTDPNNGYGLHGAPVEGGQEVLIVDDMASTGDSLLTLVDMVREEGGIVHDAVTLADRSRGLAAAVLIEKGVRLQAIYLLHHGVEPRDRPILMPA